MEDGTAADAGRLEGNVTTTSVRAIAWPVAMLIWTILGFYVWVPAIICSGILYVVSVFLAAFAHHAESMRSMEKIFRDCIEVYPEGFSRINRVLADRNGDLERIATQPEAHPVGYLVLIGVGFLVATVFWLVVLRLFGVPF